MIVPTPPGSSYVPAQVARVDDPFSEMSLLAVRGDVVAHTVRQLERQLANLEPGWRVHLDIADARIRSGPVMGRLETVADDLERRGIPLRLVGLDPLHPVLAKTL